MKLVIPFAPPGESGMIAYTANYGEGYDIWLYHPSFGENVRLTTGLGESFSVPFWSPDSNKIAFVGRNGYLYVVNKSEGAISHLDQYVDGEGIYLSWSPDSQTLAYAKQNEIILYHVLSHQVQRIAQPAATDVQWFPSSTELLFQATDRAGISQLFRIRKDGTGKRQITQNTSTRYNSVRLSPNGAYVLYTTPGASISLIYILEISTGNLVELRGGPLAKTIFQNGRLIPLPLRIVELPLKTSDIFPLSEYRAGKERMNALEPFRVALLLRLLGHQMAETSPFSQAATTKDQRVKCG